MSNVIRAKWTITPKTVPQPWRPCSRCGEQRPFRCSGKFRLNANGKRLDAWLIYKCTHCGETWNRTVIERRALRDFEPAMLVAFEANDPKLVRRFAFDFASLRKSSHRVEEFAEVEVLKELKCGSPPSGGPVSLEIVLAVRAPLSLRLDRLLSTQLGLSRSRIVALAEAGLLATTETLAKSAKDGIRIEIDLISKVDAEAIVRAALNPPDSATSRVP